MVKCRLAGGRSSGGSGGSGVRVCVERREERQEEQAGAGAAGADSGSVTPASGPCGPRRAGAAPAMVRKEDVVSWFKDLESYKRIDAMCTLLNMCLPFELRFVGAYLEELAKRDFHELRGAELRANAPHELAAEPALAPPAAAEPRTARKMALYISLLRSGNFACAATLYRAILALERAGLLAAGRAPRPDLLEEVLLLYTMALHHPAFTFDQKSHFGEVLERLRPEEEAAPQPQARPPDLSVPPPSLAPPPGLYLKSPAVQVPLSTNESGDMGSPGLPLVGPGLSVMSEVHHPPPGLGLPQYNMADFVVGQPPWAAGLIVSPLNPPIEVMNFPPPSASSPLMSSPVDSRSASPRGPHRRPSHERISPPADPPVLTTLPANFENLTVNEMRSLNDERLREIGMPPNVVSQLRSLEKLNGVRHRPGPGCCPPSRSSGSESGSSAASSPPGTPAPMQRRMPHNVQPPPGAPFPYMSFPRGFAAYPTPNAYRPPPPAFTNGEPPPYPTAGPYAGFMPVLYAPPKLSCWNCGASGHTGQDCKEPSMEEMTRAGGYQLDFAPPDPGEK